MKTVIGGLLWIKRNKPDAFTSWWEQSRIWRVRPDANCSFDCAINYANFLPNKNGHFFFRNFFLKITTNSREIPAKYQPQTGDFKKKQYRFFLKYRFYHVFTLRIQSYVRHGQKIGFVSLPLEQFNQDMFRVYDREAKGSRFILAQGPVTTSLRFRKFWAWTWPTLGGVAWLYPSQVSKITKSIKMAVRKLNHTNPCSLKREFGV